MQRATSSLEPRTLRHERVDPGFVPRDPVARTPADLVTRGATHVGSPFTFVEVTENATTHPGSGRGRVYAFTTSCPPPCRPMWQTPLLAGRPAFAVAKGRLFVASGDGLFVFATDCRTDGGTCRPLWRGRLHQRETGNAMQHLSVDQGLVAVTVGTDVGGQGDVPSGSYLFRTTCPSEWCEPLRHFQNRTTFPTPPDIRHDRLYLSGYLGAESVDAFRLDCASKEGSCRHVWKARLALSDPRLGPELHGPGILATRRSGFVLDGRTLASFPIRCGGTPKHACSPSWTARIPHSRWGPWWPRLGPEGTVLMVLGRTMLLFPRTCTTPCLPAWWWTARNEILRLERIDDVFIVGTKHEVFAVGRNAASRDLIPPP